MIWLILGLALWFAAHLFKRVLPEKRAALGDPGKGLVAGAVLLSVGVDGDWLSERRRRVFLGAVTSAGGCE